MDSECAASASDVPTSDVFDSYFLSSSKIPNEIKSMQEGFKKMH